MADIHTLRTLNLPFSPAHSPQHSGSPRALLAVAVHSRFEVGLVLVLLFPPTRETPFLTIV